MEVNVVLGSDRDAIERGGLVPPLAQRGDDFFIDAMADGLHDSRLDNVALRVDSDLNNDITLQVARKFGTRHGRIRKQDGEGNMHFMAFYWAVNHRAKGRTSTAVVVGSFRSFGQLELLGWRLER